MVGVVIVLLRRKVPLRALRIRRRRYCSCITGISSGGQRVHITRPNAAGDAVSG